MTYLRVEKAGSLSSIQDIGRLGLQRFGITQSGPMDRFSYEVAHRLVGNSPDEALIEFVGIGGSYYLSNDAERAVCCAVTAGDFPVLLNNQPQGTWQSFLLCPGDLLEIGYGHQGNYGYLAVQGGIQTPPVLGSRSTHTRAEFGGIDGRLIAAGDCLPLDFSTAQPHTPMCFPKTQRPTQRAIIRVIMGQQARMFSADEQKKFLNQNYKISNRADRMGVHLEGDPLQHIDGHDVVSDGIVMGSIQVPGTGHPIVLMADRQPTGGYPKIATIVTADLPTFAQFRPGQEFQFCSVPVDEARNALRAMHKTLSTCETLFEPVPQENWRSSEFLLSQNLVGGAIACGDHLPWLKH